MAEQFIEDIYKYSYTIYELERAVEEARTGIDVNTVDRLDRVFPKLTDICRDCINTNLNLGKRLWAEVKILTEINSDLIAIGDQIDLGVLPLIRQFVHVLADINVDIDDRYSVHSSISGYLTLYSKESGIYLHSRNDPMFEAIQYVRSFYDGSKEKYYVFGCGMGYELYALYELSDGFTHIILYEPDDIVFNTAVSYGTVSMVPEGFLERRSFENVDEFLEQAICENAGILIYSPSVHIMPEGEEKRKLITCWMGQNTLRLYEGSGYFNRIRNHLLLCPDVEEFLVQEQCDEAVVVAAGPSLSDNIELIREWQGRKKLIAVGTVFHMLLKEGIKPDCVVIIDPTKKMIDQIKGIENNKVPLLLDENVYWELPRMYTGPKYFFSSNSYEGTVASAAIEAAIGMAASKVYLLGLDLAYPVMKSHADGSIGMIELNNEKMFLIDSMDGGQVLSDNHLYSYVNIIEKQINNYPNVVFYNLSEHGAKIRGTRLYVYE